MTINNEHEYKNKEICKCDDVSTQNTLTRVFPDQSRKHVSVQNVTDSTYK